MITRAEGSIVMSLDTTRAILDSIGIFRHKSLSHERIFFPMNASDVQVIDKTTAFQGYFRIDKYRLRHRLFEGGWGTEIDREVLERGHASCCLLFDPDLDQLVFIEQFRPGAYAALDSRWFDAEKESPWQVELVAGIIDPGEEPEDVARRECLEESGCEITEIEFVARYLVSSGCSSETQLLYCGKVDSAHAGGIHGLVEEGENIRVFTIPAGEAFKRLDDGAFLNATLLIAMHWFRNNHARLRDKWAGKTK